MLEVDFGEYSSLPRAVEEVGDAGEWIAVFLRDFVQSSEIDAKTE